jgi:hypothetical protein
MKNIFLFLILLSQTAIGQKLKKSDKAIIENLKTEITYLSSDRLEGRRTGTAGEKLASEYLSDQFQKAGLKEKGDGNTFIQSFEINEGKEILPVTHLLINDSSLEIKKDYFPLIFSADGEAKGDVSPAFKEKGMPWFLDINDGLEENKNNPHFDAEDFIKNKAIEFAEKGASALIVFNSGETDDELNFDGKSKMETIKIPVIYLSKNIAKKYLSDQSANLTIDLKTALGNKKEPATM